MPESLRGALAGPRPPCRPMIYNVMTDSTIPLGQRITSPASFLSYVKEHVSCTHLDMILVRTDTPDPCPQAPCLASHNYLLPK